MGCVIFDETALPQRSRARPRLGRGDHPLARACHLRRPLGDGQQRRRAAPLDRARSHGPMALVFHDERAVPLEHYYFFENKLRLVAGRQRASASSASPTSAARPSWRACATAGAASPSATTRRASKRPRRWPNRNAMGPTGSARAARIQRSLQAEQPEEPQERPAPEPGEVLTALRAAELLPCLYFLPGAARGGGGGHRARRDICWSRRSSARRLHDEVQQWVRALPPEDQKLDQVRRLATLLPRGLGFHHAGLLPALKVMVETLFARGDLQGGLRRPIRWRWASTCPRAASSSAA